MQETTNTSADTPNTFDAWWNTPGDWVEEPNQRRTGWSGMKTARFGDTLYYIKKQNNHLYRSLRHPFGMPTTSREFANILCLTTLGIRVPEPVFHGSRRSHEGFEGLLVTRELAGFKAIAEATELTPTERRQLAIATGKTIGRLHRAHLQHSCLYDKHVMYRWQDGTPEIALIDLEKLRRPYLPWRAAQHDLNQLFRHQKIWTDSDWQQLLSAHRLTVAT